MPADRWATFDCYGTLIDWNAGIRGVLERLWGVEQAPRLLERYHEIEPRVQLGGPIPYREVLAESLRLLAESEGLELRALVPGRVALVTSRRAPVSSPAWNHS